MRNKNRKSKRKHSEIISGENEQDLKHDEEEEEEGESICDVKKSKTNEIVSYENYIDYAFHYMIMADPVFTADGFTFEKECIENWLKIHSTNPRTNSSLPNKNLTPNVDLKRNITDYLEKNLFLYERDEVYLPKEIFMEFFKDISDNNLINIKTKWLKYPDKRVFFKKFELHVNDTHEDYSAFYFASQFGTSDSTEIILDFLIKNSFLEKIKSEIPKDWKPYYLPKLVQNYLNNLECDLEAYTEKLTFLLKYNDYIKRIEKAYLVKIVKSLIEEENLEKIKKIYELIDKITNEKDKDGNSPLMLAVKYDKITIVKYFLQLNNSNKNELNTFNENCLYFAVKNKNPSMLKLLYGKNASKMPYLHLSIHLYPYNLKLVEKLVDLDISVLNNYDENNKTLLYILCENNNLKSVEFLLTKGANPSLACSSNSETVLHLACRKNYKELTKLIIKYGCIIDLVDSNEDNALHIAVQTKNINFEIIEILLENDIDYFCKNKQDKTPIDLSSNEIKELIFSASNEIKRTKMKLNADLNKNNQNLKKKIKDLNIQNQNLKKINEELNLSNTLLKLNCKNGLISGSSEIKIWDLDSGSCIKELKGHDNMIDALKILPNGNLISASRDKAIKVWDLNTGECLSTIVDAHSDIIFNLELASNGHLISCSIDKKIKIWDMDRRICVKSIKEYGRVFSLLLMENDHLICGLGKSGNIDVWNISNSDYIGAFIGHTDVVRSLKQLKSGNLASCSDDKTIKIWNTVNGELIRTLVGHQACVVNLEVMPNGNLISCSRDKTIKIWDLNRYNCIKTFKGYAKSLKMMKNGNLISSSRDKKLKIWDIEKGVCIKTLEGHANNIFSIELLNE